MENNYKYFVFKYIYEKLGLNEIEKNLIEKGIKYLDFDREESEISHCNQCADDGALTPIIVV